MSRFSKQKFFPSRAVLTFFFDNIIGYREKSADFLFPIIFIETATEFFFYYLYRRF